MDNKIICVVGPTASGKTSLAIDIAKNINGEIICADSMQIYKYLDIGTAKPTKEERLEVKHHLCDFVEPLEDFSVARYVELAGETISDIKSRGKVPIIAGGTGLYIDSLIKGNDFAKNDDSNEEIRKELYDLAEKNGVDYVFEILRNEDIESYNRLHKNDLKRVIRAIEVKKITGKTISEHNIETKKIPPKYNALMIGINPVDRQVLYNRIDKRVLEMMDLGLIDELKMLISNNYLTKTASQAIGYKELLGYIEDTETLGVCIEKIQQESRRYAKRQITWFKRNEKIHWLTDILDKEKLLFDALNIIREEFYGENL
ncbi:MAG: tRNA (adenosine(37)-N6)-dimethylallyltransferase MiaA [Clostridia bacterium]